MRHYTVKEASEELKMSEAWVRQKIFRKEIRHRKIGRRVFIPESTIEEILDRSVVEARADVNKKAPVSAHSNRHQ